MIIDVNTLLKFPHDSRSPENVGNVIFEIAGETVDRSEAAWSTLSFKGSTDEVSKLERRSRTSQYISSCWPNLSWEKYGYMACSSDDKLDIISKCVRLISRQSSLMRFLRDCVSPGVTVADVNRSVAVFIRASDLKLVSWSTKRFISPGVHVRDEGIYNLSEPPAMLGVWLDTQLVEERFNSLWLQSDKENVCQ